MVEQIEESIFQGDLKPGATGFPPNANWRCASASAVRIPGCKWDRTIYCQEMRSY